MTPTYNLRQLQAHGEPMSWRVQVNKIPTGKLITSAWLTLRNQPGDADPGVLAKAITTANVPNVGQVENAGTLEVDDGAGRKAGTLRFDVVAADFSSIVDGRDYAFDVELLYAGDGARTKVAQGWTSFDA